MEFGNAFETEGDTVSYKAEGPWLGPRLAVSPAGSVCQSAAYWSCLQTTCQLADWAADGSSEAHLNQANTYRLWLRLERAVLGSVGVKCAVVLLSHWVETEY